MLNIIPIVAELAAECREEDKALVLIAHDFERSAQAIADLQVIVAIIVYLLARLFLLNLNQT